MRIVSWNVNGLQTTLKDASARHSSISNYFTQILQADVACFQEAKTQEEKLEKWMACVPGYESFWAFCKAKKGYSGVVTYVKEDICPLDAKADFLGDFDDPYLDELCNEGRIIETDHGSFILINVYAPNAGDEDQGRLRLDFKLRFLRALKRKCDELVQSGRHFLLVGDLNIAHTDKDVHRRWNVKDVYTSEEIAFMDAFLGQYVDLFRHFHPDDEDVFSVWNQKTEARIHNEGLRIDYAICDKGFLPQVVSTDIVKMFPKNWSDHAAVTTLLKDQPPLPFHSRPALSCYNMKKFREDSKQKKLTMLLSSSACSKDVKQAEPVKTSELQAVVNQETSQADDVSIKKRHQSIEAPKHVLESLLSKARKTSVDSMARKTSATTSGSQKNISSYFRKSEG